MKKFKLFLFSIIMLFILPTITKAFTSLEISTPNPAKGTSFYIQVSLNYISSGGKDLGIKDFHAVVVYDSSFFEYESVTWQQGVYDIRNEDGKLYIDKKDDGRQWSAKTSPLMIKFKAIKVGTTFMDIKRTEESHYGNGDIIAQSFSGVTISTLAPSTNTLIGSIGVEGYNIEPTFKKTTNSYYTTVPPRVTSVKIIAKPSDDKQTVEGGGVVSLEYGKNVFEIKVTAQDGSTNVYTLTITRQDDRTGDTSLKSLDVSDTDIKYVDGVTNYTATVSRSVETVLISARTNDPMAYMTGTGRKGLKIGENHFQLYVTSSNHTETTYNITIIRSTEEIEKAVKSSKLKTLKVNSLGIDLSNDKKVFLIGVRNDVKDLPIEAVGESKTATITVTGDKDLKEGINPVNIHVKEIITPETEETQEESLEDDYKLIVYRNPDNAEVVTSLKDINTRSNIVYSSTETSNHIIPSEGLKYIKNNNLTLYYNVINIYNGLIYQARITNPEEDGDIDAAFKETDEGSGDYYTKLPKGTIVTLYVGDKYDDGTNVRIYTYTGDSGYKLLTDGLSVINGYIEFTLSGDTNYVITLKELIKEKGPFDLFFSNYGGIILGAMGGLIGLTVIIVLINKQKAKKDSKEPSY